MISGWFKKIWVLLLLCAAAFSIQAGEKVRVGFFAFDGYHKLDADRENPSDGRRSGYGYDLLQLLIPYNGWNYEYIGYDRGWSEMLSMLENGEIDLVTSAVKTPEREKRFDFSARPVGFSSVILSVKAGCEKYRQDDYANWNGIRVGMLAKNSKNDVFAAFAKEKNFQYHAVTFVSQQELTDALQDGTIDAIVTGSLRKPYNEWIYERLDVRPFYIIVKKGNQKLLAEINFALDQLELNDPGFFLRLQTRYYDANPAGDGTVQYNQAEREFIEESQRSGHTFSVLINPDCYPYSTFENGRLAGLMKYFLDEFTARTGLKLVPVVTKDRSEYFELARQRKCDLILDMLGDRSLAENHGYVLTPPYFSSMIVKLSLKGGAPGNSIAVARKFDARSKRMLAHDGGIEKIVVYDTLAETIDAVRRGRQASAYVFSEAAQCAIWDDASGIFMLDPKGFSIDLSIAVNKDRDRRLLTILSKAALSLSKNDVAQTQLMDDIRRKRSVTLREWMNQHPVTMVLISSGVILFFSVCLLLVILSLKKSRKAYAELRKNSRMWKLLIDSLPIHIFAKDVAHDSRYVFNNQARCEFFRFPKGQTDGFSDSDFLPEEFAKARREEDLRISRNPGEKVTLMMEARNTEGEMRQLRCDQITFKDADGTLLVLGCSMDVTDFEHAKKRAEENAEWFRKTLISIGDGVMTTDLNGEVTLLNPVAERLLGITLADAMGKKHTDVFRIVSGVDGTPVASPVARALEKGEIVELANHTDLLSADGHRYHVADSAAPIVAGDGRVVGAILVFRDVTREYELRAKLEENAVHLREALSQAEAASSAKGSFLSQMSHEIRTPLNAIIGYLNIARDSENDGGKVDECLVKGLSASGHLLSIINDILDISSIESGKLKIASEDFDFKHLLTGIVSMFYNQAQAKGINFEMSLRGLTEEWLVGDALRVNQILLNLLSNAMKFTPSGGNITLTVRQIGIVQRKVQLMIEVADTGCGMSEEYKKRLFTPFEQQDASTARKFGGTGLGLSITKNLVTMMQGTIDVASQENVGTTFTVHLSFAQSQQNIQSAEADFSKIRALVVDDNADDLNYMQMVLSKCGVKSDPADSGEAAVRQLERRASSRHPYDICLLDLKLPGIDGIETAKRIRALESCRNLPVILVTAYDVTAVVPEARSAGVNKVISKPLFQSTFFDFLMTTYYHMQDQKKLTGNIAALKGLRILLVEDNQMNMDISMQYLTKNGMIVTSAWNGKEAVEKFIHSAPGTYQTILMDIQMPVMDGYEATSRIRASAHPEAKTIPIIAMTANAFNEDVVKALNSGMNDHISKPIVFEQLFDSLTKLTKKHES